MFYSTGPGYSPLGLAPGLTANIRLGSYGLTGANTLDYFMLSASVTKKKLYRVEPWMKLLNQKVNTKKRY